MDQSRTPIRTTGSFALKIFPPLTRDDRKLKKTARKSKIKTPVKITPIQIKNRGNSTNSLN